jgi:molybdopterin/thiamine biosynthesis adenylyltransferase
MTPSFDYDTAFSRNIGWVTEREQRRLRESTVAIAGMGGVGGAHLLTLARLGIGKFRIADFDCFDLANFNRQAGANLATIGKPKVAALVQMAREINPDLEFQTYERGLEAANVESFIRGADVYVDGLDFFAFDIRALTFETCRDLGVPAVTAAPLGMGAALLNFTPNGMAFEDYFGWQGQTDEERAIRFMIGLAPRLLHDYLADPSRVNLERREGPSTVMACQMCAGFAATEVLKFILGRGKILAAPRSLQYDAYRNKLVTTWRPGGNRNPVQRVMLAVARRRLAALRAKAASQGI